jgi:hypothetical protein
MIAMPDTESVRWHRVPGSRWKVVGFWLPLTTLFGGVLVVGAIISPGARALSLTGAVCVFGAGSVAGVWAWRAAGIGVADDHLIVWDAAATRHLLPWSSVEGFDVEKKWNRGSGEVTLVVIRTGGRRLHASGCTFSGTDERSWAAARALVRALELERRSHAPENTGP